MTEISNENHLGQNIYYDHQLIPDKHYFGAFLNQAIDNLEEIKDLLFEKYKIEARKTANGKKRGDLKLVFPENLAYSDWDLRIKYSSRYLPFIRELYHLANTSGTDRTAIIKSFTTTLDQFENTLKSLRNFYTHHYHKPLSIPDSLFDTLDQLLVSAAVSAKKRRMKDDKVQQVIRKSLSIEYKLLFQNKRAQLEEKKKENKLISLDPEQIHAAVINDSFKHLLYKEKGTGNVSVKDGYKSKEMVETSRLLVDFSSRGLVFFLCLFLTKRQGEELRSRLKGFKGKAANIFGNPSGLKNMATHWTYSALALKSGKLKLSTDFHKESLLVQMVDELSKVPHEVYECLSEADKQEFLEDINEYIREGNADYTLAESRVVHPVIRKRYEDKFNYFALRFLDEFRSFDTLRFQVCIGNYVHDKRTKFIEGTQVETSRTIREKITICEKLSTVSSKKRKYWETSEDKSDWEFYPNPFYNFVGNCIPIYIRLNKDYKDLKPDLQELIDGKKQAVSEITRMRASRKKLPKEQIAQIINKVKLEKSEPPIGPRGPEAFLSLNELPALLHAILVKKISEDDIEKMIVESIQQHRRTIINFEPGQDIPNSKISTKLKHSKEESESYDFDKMLRSLGLAINDCDNRLTELDLKIREAKIQRRDRTFDNQELGEIAFWLSGDIVRFLPKSSRKSWRGYHHSHLQQLLAFYNARRNELDNFLDQTWKNAAGPFWIPELRGLFRSSSFDVFYRGYLQFRKEILSGFKLTIEQHRGNQSLIQKELNRGMFIVFRKRDYLTRKTKDLQVDLLTRPFLLPRGIFDPKPTFVKDKKPLEHPTLFAEWYVSVLQEIQNRPDKFQSFYQTPRDYQDLFDIEKKNNPDFIQNKKKLSASDQFSLLKMKQDLKIKTVKIQDIFIKKMLERIFEQVLGHTPNFELADLYLTKAQKLEIQERARAQSSRGAGDDSPNIYNEDFLWNKTTHFKKGQLEEKQVKIKDVGKLHRLVQSAKVRCLFDYASERIWSVKELEDELALYERLRRETILKEIQEFESTILLSTIGHSQGTHPPQFEQDGDPNFKCYIINGVIRSKGLETNDTLERLLKMKSIEDLSPSEFQDESSTVKKAIALIFLRNKFCHDQLPSKAWFSFFQALYPMDSSQISFVQYLQRVVSLAIKDLNNK